MSPPREKTIAIVQSNYIPWKGYFDLINSVDEFVLFDDMQYTRRDWRNRNKIKTANGVKWLTIPVQAKGKYTQAIRDVIVADADWATKHLKSIVVNYARSDFFADFSKIIEQTYLEASHLKTLSEINYLFIQTVCGILGILTEISWSWDYELENDKNLRLVSICKQAAAKHYISGPAAKTYLNDELFAAEDIAVSYFDYNQYPEYKQLYPPFDHHVTILDLIFNTGKNAKTFMRSF
jgi:hypothetical protein